MTIPEQNNNPIVEISIPVSTQQALEKVNATKSAWLEARRQQKRQRIILRQSASAALKWKPRRTP